MRGNPFHNTIAHQAEAIFVRLNWHVSVEYYFTAEEITGFFDLLATKEQYRLACEIETTPRHAVDNAIKAQKAHTPLWFIVPTKKLKDQIAYRLKTLNIMSGKKPIKILLLRQLEQELACYPFE